MDTPDRYVRMRRLRQSCFVVSSSSSSSSLLFCFFLSSFLLFFSFFLGLLSAHHLAWSVPSRLGFDVYPSASSSVFSVGDIIPSRRLFPRDYRSTGLVMPRGSFRLGQL
ncbi:hypothetical protein LX36DRAFT_657383, partial [Colletotrichum falcatum]